MDRYLRNAVAVLFATALTAMAVYGIVLLVSPGGSYTSLASSSASTGQAGVQTCPATGCTASSCHATSGGRGASRGGSVATQRQAPAGFEFDD